MRNEVILIFYIQFFIIYAHSFVIKSQAFFNRLYGDSNDVIKYTRKNPLRCRVESVKLIGRYDDSCEFYHITLSHKQPFYYDEGQYCTVIPPTDELSNTRFAPRAYSISNSAKVLGNDNIIEFCVRKFINPATNSPGICSSYLIGSKIGDIIDVAGPFGRLNISKLLLNNNFSKEASNLIVFATGTGIAPIRSFYKFLFNNKNIEFANILNKFLLVYGVKNENCLLYKEELEDLEGSYQGRFNILRVFSRAREKRYVQDVIMDNPQYIKSFINNNSKMVICGTKGMVLPIQESLQSIISKSLYKSILDNMLIEVY